MSRKLFGTDGVRGTANTYPMTADLALRLGAAAGRYFGNDGANGHRVVIGKDTRLSGYMFENALTAGLTSTGMNVLLLGPVPTPAVGMLTTTMRADLGIMISASHNPHHDNGIKFFGPDGFKLSDAAEAEIEALLEGDPAYAPADRIGRAKRIDDGRFRYAERVKSTFPAGKHLTGLKVVIDCANGAAYRVAPEVLWELGAEVIPVGVAPNGRNINEKCGSTSPALAAETIVAHGADMGICLDGDADRVMILDETGKVADGDQIMALMATRWAAEGRLNHGTLVATVMSNLGLERFLQGKGLRLERTAVGDRYVLAKLRETGGVLGGETSGHLLTLDQTTTGDAMIAALQVLGVMCDTGKSLAELTAGLQLLPQVMINVRVKERFDPYSRDSVRQVVDAVNAELDGRGRVVLRASGTEPLIRVMVEAEESAAARSLAQRIADAVQAGV